ncbi:MAG: hypothetical protein ACREFE_03955 [Limisphaerales bacterium]
MKNTFCNLSMCLICFAGLALRVAAQPDSFGGNPDSNAFIRIPPDSDDWTRHFRIGALVGMNISAGFSTKGTINTANAADGIFDDGYVRPDRTGDASYTGYWGYKYPSQLTGNILTMTRTTSFSTIGGSGSSTEDGSPFPGFDMAYGDNLWYWKHARVGWELGFGLLPIDITQNESMGVNINQYTYTFNTGGVVVPDAPYQGGPGGSGEPIIPLAPSSTSGPTSSSGTIAGTRSLDVMLYTLRFGPSFYWDLTDKFGMSLGVGPAVGLVSGDYKYDEIITDTADNISAHNKGQIGGNSIVFGGYVNATVMYHLVDNGDIYVGAQYMPMSDATISGSGRQGQLNLGGQIYLSIGINWPF